MIVDHAHKIAYFSIPKVACSSLKSVMFELSTGEPWKRNTAYGDRPPAAHIHQHFPSRPWNRIDHDAIRGYWKFAVVRDPVSRVLSAYKNKVVDQRILHTKPPGPNQKPERHAAYAEVDKDPDASTFCRNIARYRAASNVIDRHTKPFRFFLGPDLSFFDAVYPIENIDQAIQDLSDRTGKSIKLPHRNRSGGKVRLDELDREAFSRIVKFTRGDYELLADFYTVPTYPRRGLVDRLLTG